MKTLAVFLLGAAICATSCAAETRTLTLRQALELALPQNPDLVIARLDQQKARDQVDINKDAFSPKVYAGSGAAWTYGFPTSIDGSAPSIVQAPPWGSTSGKSHQINLTTDNIRFTVYSDD